MLISPTSHHHYSAGSASHMAFSSPHRTFEGSLGQHSIAPGQQHSASPAGEPMALGSPPSSPPSSSGPTYLPNYLMGDSPAGHVASPSSRLWPGMTSSPQKSFSSFSLPSAGQGHHTLSTSSFHKSTPDKQPEPSVRVQRMQGVKPSGPPVQGLFDSLSTPTHSPATGIAGDSMIKSPATHLAAPSLHSESSWQHHSAIASPTTTSSKTFLSPAQIDPFYTQGESISYGEELDETWVTIFGFPPAAASYILQQFSQYGTILEHKMSPSGNWMHVHYQSNLQAKKALCKNGKVFAGSIMVGVQPCIDKSVMDESHKENSQPSGSAGCPSLSQRSSSTVLSPKIRPLTQSYRTSAGEFEVTSQSRTPQKKTGFLSTAMDYVFGW